MQILPLAAAAVLAIQVGLASGCQAGYVIRQGFHQIRGRGEEVRLDDPEIESKVGSDAAQKLRWLPGLLEFARTELGLEPGDSYSTYVDTHGAPVSYAVTAAHPLALVPFEWQFPFAGRVPYKGFFAEEDARAEAARLRARGLETLVSPVEAYSTLGWFRDPVVSSMLDGNTADLVDVILHETTHRTVYFPGHSSFNESLASFVARKGAIRFLTLHAELRGELTEYVDEKDWLAQREALLLRLRNDLDALYRCPEEPGVKEARKAEIFATASAAYRRLRRQGKGSLPASNAFVLSVSRYHELEPLFEALLRKLAPGSNGDPAPLVAYLKKLPPVADPVAAVERALLEGAVPQP